MDMGCAERAGAEREWNNSSLGRRTCNVSGLPLDREHSVQVNSLKRARRFSQQRPEDRTNESIRTHVHMPMSAVISDQFSQSARFRTRSPVAGARRYSAIEREREIERVCLLAGMFEFRRTCLRRVCVCVCAVGDAHITRHRPYPSVDVCVSQWRTCRPHSRMRPSFIV